MQTLPEEPEARPDTPEPTRSAAARELDAELYRELRSLARAQVLGGPPAATLQPTALVHEAWLRLSGPGRRWRDRDHFLAAAALAMRRLLANHARDRAALKRGGGAGRVELDAALTAFEARCGDLLDLEVALARLERLEPRAARVVELRFFAGLELEEVAAHLRVSRSTVERDWVLARAFLRTRMQDGGSG